MLRRCMLRVSLSRQPVRGSAKRAVARTPFLFYVRSALSTASQSNSTQNSAITTGKPSSSGKLLLKVVIGTTVVGAAVGAAYQTGYIGVKHEQSSLKSDKLDSVQNLKVGDHSQGQAVLPSKEPNFGGTILEFTEKIDEHRPSEDTDAKKKDASEIISLKEEPSLVSEEVASVIEEEQGPVRENELPSFSQDLSEPDEQITDLRTPSMHGVDVDSRVESLDRMITTDDSMEQIKMTDMEKNEVTDTPTFPQETMTSEVQPNNAILEEVPKKDLQDHEPMAPSSLFDQYSLQKDEQRPGVSVSRENTDISVPLPEEKEVSVIITPEESGVRGGSVSEKIVFDLIEAIHVAERRQAESDLRTFDEEIRKLKEKYEKELRDARARELMCAEEAAILAKELNKERIKGAATAKLVQEKAEEKLRTELQQKEEEAELHFKKLQELHKADLKAAIAKEKLSHMEKMTEANLHIKALCMAFYAISEETHQSYSVHKLSLGVLALEDALSKGLPIREEIDALHSSLAGPDGDLVLDLLVTTLPEETLLNGTATLLQLHQKFDALKGTLQHFSLIPPGGGGILAHVVTHIASSIKVRECNQSGTGIESVVSRVERFLAEGNLAEAADALEEGVSGTEAEGAAAEWVRQARNRAVTEQALALLQAYATSISLT